MSFRDVYKGMYMEVMKVNYGLTVSETYPDGDILWYKDILIHDDKAWVVAGNYNALFEVDIKNNKSQYLGSFLGESCFGQQLYGRMFYCYNKLIAVPLYAESIGIYDFLHNDFRKIELPVPKSRYQQSDKFLSAVQYSDKIFMFPGYYSYILELDTCSEEIKIHEEWYSEHLKYGVQCSCCQFYSDMVVREHTVYLVSAQYNVIFQFDMDTGDYRFEKVGEGELTTLAFEYDHFWTVNTNGQLFKWNPETKITEMIDISSKSESTVYIFSYFIDNILVLIPSNSNKVLYVDITNIHIVEKELPQDTVKKEALYDYHRFYFAKLISKEKILVLDRSDRRLKVFDKEGLKDWLGVIRDCSSFAKTVWDVEEYFKYCMDIFWKDRPADYRLRNCNAVFRENSIVNVGTFLHLMWDKMSVSKEACAERRKKNGCKIYDNLCFYIK